MNRMIRSIKRAFHLFLALQFGRYSHSGWDGVWDYHIYEYRGEKYRYTLPQRKGMEKHDNKS